MAEYINVDEEYNDPDTNLMVLIGDYQKKLKALAVDKTTAQDSEVRGFAEKRYLELRKEYYHILAKDMEILKLYESSEESTDQS